MEYTFCHNCGSTRQPVFDGGADQNVCADCDAKWEDRTSTPIYRPLSEKMFPSGRTVAHASTEITVGYSLSKEKPHVLLQFVTAPQGTAVYEWAVLPREHPNNAAMRARKWLIKNWKAEPLGHAS